LFKRIVPILLVSLLISACGSTERSSSDGASPDASGMSSTSGSVDSGELAGAGQMIVRYDDAASPEAVSGKQIYQDHKMLEDMADGVNYLFDLPYDVPVVGLQCDVSNAFWNTTEQQMELCYEFIDDLQSQFRAAGEADPLNMAMDATYATFFHEMGHMVIDIYDLPITGREEDVADQVAAFMLLQPGEDEQLDGESVEVMMAMAELFELFAAQDGEPDESAFADEHSPDKVRVYNLLCWTFGADPDGNVGIVDNGLLPEDRAVRCEDEFDQINRSWITLLAPHMKQH
jgi:hypothetical protein